MKRLNGKTQKILLIGDVGKALLDADKVAELCEVRTDISDGIAAAAKYNFAGVGVVMSGAPSKLRSALKTLREVNRNAKIILLARMSEEPTAIELVVRGCNGTTVADDYLVCPIDFSHLESRILYLVRGESAVLQQPIARTTPAGAVDAATRRKMELLEKLATEDDLTGLKNRRYIWEFFRQIMERAREESGRVTLLVFDIDDFKRYNDAYGHRAGDEILKQAAILMRRCCRQHDVVGRIGGDEFAVVFWDDPARQPPGTETERRSAMADHPKEAIFIAKRFVGELEKAELSAFSGLGPAGKGVLTISGGLASFPRDGSTTQELFQQADQALLEAKRSGKNRIYLVGSPAERLAGKPQSDIAHIK